MKALVTGSTGCVGSALVERLLEKGFEVRALARKTSDLRHLRTTGAEIVFGDITDCESLRAAAQGVDVVFHAAAKVTPGWGTWEEFERTTVRGTQNLLEAAAAAGCQRFVQVSSFTVYGEACMKGDMAADETTECAVCLTPKTYYDYAKLLAERSCWEYQKQGKIKVSMIRIGSAYGPRDRLISDRLYRYAASPVILWPGMSNPRYAIVHSRDIADLCILAATSEKAVGEVYNVACPEPTRLREFTQAIVKARGGRKVWGRVPFSVAYVSCYLMELIARMLRAKEMPFLNRYFILQLNQDIHLDASKAGRDLGWVPQVSLEEGTREYVQWRREEAAHKHGTEGAVKSPGQATG